MKHPVKRLQKRRAEIARNKAKLLRDGAAFRRAYDRLLIQSPRPKTDDERVK